MPGAIWLEVQGSFSEVWLVWDLDSRDDPLRSVFSAFCNAHGSLSCRLLKKEKDGLGVELVRVSWEQNRS